MQFFERIHQPSILPLNCSNSSYPRADIVFVRSFVNNKYLSINKLMFFLLMLDISEIYQLIILPIVISFNCLADSLQKTPIQTYRNIFTF